MFLNKMGKLIHSKILCYKIYAFYTTDFAPKEKWHYFLEVIFASI